MSPEFMNRQTYHNHIRCTGAFNLYTGKRFLNLNVQNIYTSPLSPQMTLQINLGKFNYSYCPKRNSRTKSKVEQSSFNCTNTNIRQLAHCRQIKEAPPIIQCITRSMTSPHSGYHHHLHFPSPTRNIPTYRMKQNHPSLHSNIPGYCQL